MGADVEELLEEGQVAAGHLGEVVPAGEAVPGALDHDRPDLGVARELLERLDDLVHEGERQRVALLGPVEHDPPGGRSAMHEHVLEVGQGSDGVHESLLPFRRSMS